MPNCELISNYTISSKKLKTGTWNGLPILNNTNDMQVVNPVNIDLSANGLLIKANNNTNDTKPDKSYLGENVIKIENNQTSVQKIDENDSNIEGKLFTHLFAYGKYFGIKVIVH